MQFLCLQNLCKELHQKTDVVDEERYDIQSKVGKNEKEVHVVVLKMPLLMHCLIALTDASAIDCRFKPQNLWAEGKNEETCLEESEGVCWSHDGGSARCQTQGIHWL